MAEPWHACIDSELDEVEKLMMEDLEYPGNAELTEMCQYVVSSGGKRLRPAFCILSYYLNGGTDPMVPIRIGSAFEIIHSASLVHDDINDQGQIRRGRKTLHREYTVSKAIIAGDYMFAMGFRLLSINAPTIVDYIVEASASMGAGEFVQKDYEHACNVSQDDYIEIIKGKTARLFEASSKSGAAVAGADMMAIDRIGDFSLQVGLAFQIVDDTLDVTGDIHNTGKAVGTDLLEGKPTLPVIYAMEDPVHGPRIKELFRKVDVTDADVREALDLIKKTDAVDRCLDLAKRYVVDARSILDSYPDSEYKDAFLNLADFIVSRNR